MTLSRDSYTFNGSGSGDSLTDIYVYIDGVQTNVNNLTFTKPNYSITINKKTDYFYLTWSSNCPKNTTLNVRTIGDLVVTDPSTGASASLTVYVGKGGITSQQILVLSPAANSTSTAQMKIGYDPRFGCGTNLTGTGTVSSNQTWAVASYNNGVVTVTANSSNANSYTPRSATITVTSNGVSGSIFVYQMQGLYRSVGGYQYIDIGLSNLVISRFLLGATNEQGSGAKKFAWGETTEKSSYTWENYIYNDGASGASNPTVSNMTKYNDTDGLTTLESSDDPAQVLMGGGWRLPTYDEMKEIAKKDNWSTKCEKLDNTGCRALLSPSTGLCILPSLTSLYSGGAYLMTSSLSTSSKTNDYGPHYSANTCANDNLNANFGTHPRYSPQYVLAVHAKP